jgi:hypothetical protein
MHLMKLVFVLTLLPMAAFGQPTTMPTSAPAPVGLPNVTAPDIDPNALLDKPRHGALGGRTFRAFMSSSFATADVWIYAKDDAKDIYDASFQYPFPRFYRPSWRETFDIIARQIGCKWCWNPENRQFAFERTDDPPPFGVTIADGWVVEDRGLYLWYAPKGKPCGLDIYWFGHYTNRDDDPELFSRVREYFAIRSLADWPNPPTLQDMSIVKVGNHDALFITRDAPRGDVIWRQWSMVIDGNAYLIVSAIEKADDNLYRPQVEQMLASFRPAPKAP